MSLHIALTHSPSIVRALKLPIGLFSEEPLEAMHKVVRSFRLNFSRKIDRLSANEDVFKRLLINSDVYLSELRCIKTSKKRVIPNDLKNLLVLEEEDLIEVNIENAESSALDFDFEE